MFRNKEVEEFLLSRKDDKTAITITDKDISEIENKGLKQFIEESSKLDSPIQRGKILGK